MVGPTDGQKGWYIMREPVVSREVKRVVIEGYKVVINADGTPAIESVRVDAPSASQADVDKVSRKHGLTGARVVEETAGIYAVSVPTFIRIARVLVDGDSRRDLITRTIEYTQYTVYSIVFDGDGKPQIAQKLVEVDSRMTEKQVLKMYNAQTAVKSGTHSVLMGCTLDKFMEHAKPITR